MSIIHPRFESIYVFSKSTLTYLYQSLPMSLGISKWHPADISTIILLKTSLVQMFTYTGKLSEIFPVCVRKFIFNFIISKAI